MQKSCRMRTRRSRPPSIVIISRMRGEVEVRYVRWVRELKSGSGEVVSSAVYVAGWLDAGIKCGEAPLTSSVVKLGGYTDTCPVLGWKRKVALPHRWI